MSSSYYSLLEVAMQDHMNFVSGLPPSVVYHLLKTLTDGLTGLGRWPGYLCVDVFVISMPGFERDHETFFERLCCWS